MPDPAAAPVSAGGLSDEIDARAADVEARVAGTLRGKPAALLFGRKDPVLASDATIARWREEFPEASCVELPDAGHYIQEDAPDACVTAIRAVLAAG